MIDAASVQATVMQLWAFSSFWFLNMVVKTTCAGYQRHIHLHLMKCCSGVTRRLKLRVNWKVFKIDSSAFSLSPSFQEYYCHVDAGLVWGLPGNTIKINHNWTHWSQIREKRVAKELIWKWFENTTQSRFYGLFSFFLIKTFTLCALYRLKLVLEKAKQGVL